LWFPEESLAALGEEAGESVTAWMREDLFIRPPNLRRIGIRSGDLPAIREALHDPDAGVRRRAATLLGIAAAGREENVRLLTGALIDRAFPVRAAAAASLGWLGPAAGAAVPSLERLLADRRRCVRDAARCALEAIRGD
jgi:HEAT repeat protein